MSFNYSPDSTILIFLILYLLFYGAYLVRMYFLTRTTRSRFNPVLYKFCLRSVYFSLFLIALLGPSFGVSKKEVQISNKQIFIAADLSRSMQLKDLQPSRFQKMKAAIKRIIQELPENRFGLIIFASEAYLHSPLTSDVSALNILTDVLSPELLEAGGTDISEAIRFAIDKFELTTSADNSKKILILLSDGEDFSNDLRRAANEAANAGITIYTIGIGTDRGAELISEGKSVLSRLERKSLMEIAQVTGGEFYEISNEKEETLSVIQQINALTGQTIVVKKADFATNKYFYFLFPALILMMLDVIVTLNIIRI